MTATETRNKAKEFVEHLQRFAGRGSGRDRAALAALRRGLGKRPGEAPEMFPYLVPWTAGMDDRSQEMYYLVASLFALHPESWAAHDAEDARERRQRNFGASMRRVALKEDEDVAGSSTERRFVALLNSDRDQLPERLRHAVSLCAAKEVPVDWAGLLEDLLYWPDNRHRVQRSWAAGFWSRPASASDDTEDAKTTE